jgi:hypothetical protein
MGVRVLFLNNYSDNVQPFVTPIGRYRNYGHLGHLYSYIQKEVWGSVDNPLLKIALAINIFIEVTIVYNGC